MNRRRSTADKTPSSVFLTLILAALVATSGGVLHAVWKNRQILVERKIDATERRIEQHLLDIQITGVRMDEMLNRFELRERLRTAGSGLVSIEHGDIEEVVPAAQPAPAVASAGLN